MPSRRRFLAAAGAAAVALPLGARAQSVPDLPPAAPSPIPVPPAPAGANDPPSPRAPLVAPAGVPTPVKPPRLRPGDLVGIVSPAGATFSEDTFAAAERELRRLGFRTVRGPHALDQHGYLGGTDVSRAADVMRMFRDPSVKAILAMRGGWGSARLLPYLDFEAIRQNPKIVCGYSDVTGLLSALYARTGLVSFHGPVASSTWNPFTESHFRRTVQWGDAYTLVPSEGTVVTTITPGVARGRLLGGNLSVFSALVGTGYVPPADGHVLFLEEVQEEPYRVDRMMTQLKLAGLFDRAAAVVFGNCRACDATGAVSLSLQTVLRDHLVAYRMPVFYGTNIGHIADKFTVPVGIEAEVDATRGTIRLLEPAVA